MSAPRERPAAWRSEDLPTGVGQAALGYVLSGLGGCLILLARDLAVGRNELSWLASGFGAALLLVGVVGRWLLALGAGPMLRAAAAVLAVSTDIHAEA
jgi:hypothetical protein